MKLAIIGSRDFNDYELLKESLKNLSIDIFLTDVISGGAKGADSLGEKWANEFNIPITIFKPDWSIGKHAGFLRNKDIIENSDIVYAFWDGKSKGTKNSIDLANRLGKVLHIIQYENI